MRALSLVLIVIAANPANGLPLSESLSAFQVIVNPTNPTPDLSTAKLREILLGGIREWPDHRRITIVQRESNNPVIASVLKEVLGMSSRDYTRYLLQLEFKGSEALRLKTLVSDEGACEFVHNAPGSIAFFSAATLASLSCGSQVRIISVAAAERRSGRSRSR